jgi:hypothetical protein
VDVTPAPAGVTNTGGPDEGIVFRKWTELSAEPASPEASGDVIDVFTVPINDTAVQSNVVLQQDVLYSVLISGMFLWGQCDPYWCPGGAPDYSRWGDAGYLSDDHFEPGQFSDPMWNDIIYLTINGVRPVFAEYNPDHLYVGQTYGNGQKLTFYIHDCPNCWADNAANLRVEIIEGYPTSASAIGVKPFQQRSLNPDYSDWGDDPYGDPDYVVQPNDCGSDILHCGCRLTTWAMTLDHIGLASGAHTNPGVLNQWLRTHDGYNGLYVDPGPVLKYAATVMGLGTYRLYRGGHDVPEVSQALSQNLPVNLKAPAGPFDHHVLAVGETYDLGGDGTFYINDPYFENKFSLVPTLYQRYGDAFYEYAYIAPDPAEYGWIFFALASPAEFVVTDPLGRKTGYDPISDTSYSEIPEAYYVYETIIDPTGENYSEDPHVYKGFELYEPIDGEYLISVIGVDSGTYTLYARAFDSDLGEAHYELSEEITPDEVKEYELLFSSLPQSPQPIYREIMIDIRPETQTNAILCTRPSLLIPVAILTTDELNALDVDPESVTFEGAFETTKGKGKVERIVDVDGDGDLDLQLYFQLGETGLTCESVEATLQGLTYDNIPVLGTDTVNMKSGSPPNP